MNSFVILFLQIGGTLKSVCMYVALQYEFNTRFFFSMIYDFRFGFNQLKQCYDRLRLAFRDEAGHPVPLFTTGSMILNVVVAISVMIRVADILQRLQLKRTLVLCGP